MSNNNKNTVCSYRPNYERSPLVRVNRKNPCPICGKHDWCSVSANGELAFCCRESAGSIKQASNEAYIHLLKYEDDVVRPTKKVVTAQPSEQPIADIVQRDRAYRSLLNDHLKLSPQHADNLFNVRGLSDERIAYNGYASLPSRSNMPKISKLLANEFRLNGIPGFFKSKDGDWLFNVNGHPGFLIPVYDSLGRIQGLQIRRDNVGEDQSRYIWFSSRNFLEGTGSGTPIHFVNSDIARQTGFAVIIEGPLKADICAEKTSLCVIAVAGVQSFNNSFAQYLKKEIPELKKVAIAFDSDWEDKKPVRDAILRLINNLKDNNLGIKIWFWDTKFKGLDDFILAGGQIA